MREFWFKFVHAATKMPLGPATMAGLSADICAADFRKAVVDKCPLSVEASQLLVYASSNMDSPLELIASAEQSGKTADDPIVVEVLPSQHVVADVPQVGWSAAVPRSQLIVSPEDPIIELPRTLVNEAGLSPGDTEKLMLYRRAKLVDQWQYMNEYVVQKSSLVWIVGPSGVGKSCTALAFSCSLEPALWGVIWIHYSHEKESFNCVKLQQASKTVRVVALDQMNAVLPEILESASTDRNTIAFLDGYIRAKEVMRVKTECKYWHKSNIQKHRLVCVCARRMIDFRVFDYCIRSKPEVKDQVLFELFLWTFDEYKQAIQHDGFYQCVDVVLLVYHGRTGVQLSEQEQRVERLQDKYLVAGGSARAMFGLSVDAAVDHFDMALEQVPSMKIFTQMMGERLPAGHEANRLVATYDIGCYNVYESMISRYVVRRLAVQPGPQVPEYLKTYTINPSQEDHLFDAWFFAHVRASGLAVEYRRNGSDKLTGGWERCKKWSVGGYDAVFMDQARKSIRFVQLTRTLQRSFNYFFFVEFLNKQSCLGSFTAVDVCFVVPKANLSSFVAPTNELDVADNILRAASVGRCTAQVAVVGVNYTP